MSRYGAGKSELQVIVNRICALRRVHRTCLCCSPVERELFIHHFCCDYGRFCPRLCIGSCCAQFVYLWTGELCLGILGCEQSLVEKPNCCCGCGQHLCLVCQLYVQRRVHALRVDQSQQEMGNGREGIHMRQLNIKKRHAGGAKRNKMW